MAIKVTLRQKEITKNRQSLYLDFYPPIPHPETFEPTRREFLGLYIQKPVKFKKQTDKKGIEKLIPVYDNNPAQNILIESSIENTLHLAEQIRQKREKQLNGNEALSDLEKRWLEKDKAEQAEKKEFEERDFLAYFKSIADKRTGTTKQNWVSANYYLERFTKENLRFADLNERFCNEFKEYLLTTKSKKNPEATLSQNSAVSYFNKFKSSLKQAYKDGYLTLDLNSKIECIKEQEVIKQTLTIEELNLLANAECKYPKLKSYVLFIALTGMPYLEMKNLNWGQIEVSEAFGIRIKMRRQKSKKGYYINISEQAYSLLGERKEPTDQVFEALKNKHRNDFFPLWLAETGIKKEMTFHDLRHTYGTLQIDLGTDIYTLQGNMGHSTARQTMHYAKISDQRKRGAADKIKLDI